MLRKLQAFVMLLSMFSYAAAETVSIGTVSARGDMRVDSYMVKGNATLFDGSVVETGQAPADLRLSKGTEITLATGSRGTLYRDRLVLQRGEGELAANSSFQLEANGLRVTPSQPNSHGVVLMKSGSTIEVTAFAGSFGVTNDKGILLASVRPGQALSFAMQAGTPSDLQTFTGTVTKVHGHFFLTNAQTGLNVQLEGPKLAQLVGKTVTLTGNTSVSTAGTTVLSVTSAQVAAAASTAGTAGGAGAAAAGTAGLSKRAITGITVVAAAAATLGGLAAAGALTPAAAASR